jgi:leucyl-tRNA synthetase
VGDRFYNLVEFPYPSADGLHVGHVFKYAGADAYGRYQRMRGHEVFQPMGWDAFGINAENYALKIGEHPSTLIARTTANFRRQLSSIDCAWDWDACVDTSKPEYYRWTQWIFLQLFRAGLAYRAEAPVVWCPSCLTVLAREQVEGGAGGDGADRERKGVHGTCERCDTPVVERVMRQWFLRTTAYADRLLDGLEALDWPDRSKRLQRNWIGRDEARGTYRMHDWLISRQRYWGSPIPIVYCDACGTVPVPEDQLPIVLPYIEDFRPRGTDASPLATDPSFLHTECPACGGPACRETDVADTFLESSWYFLRYPCVDRDDVAWDERVRPVDFYAGGHEHVQRHHLYARFVTMALYDLGLVPFEEPFTRVRLGGLMTHAGAKMSKSKGNVVGPDEYLERYGSDVTRLALLFTMPWEHTGDFRDEQVAGAQRFLAKVRRWFATPEADNDEVEPADAAIERVTRAMEGLKFNVAIATLMEWRGRIDRSIFVRLLAPLAPGIAEELRPGVLDQPWPS